MRVASRLSSCVAVVATATLLTSCGTSAYCTTVEEQRGALDDVAMTTASLTALGEALRAIEKQAPTHVQDDYAAVAESVEALLAAESVAGVPVEELTHGDVVDLSEGDTTELRNAYQAFNDTATQRRAIADDVTDDCDITLKTPGA
ncbi:hypothetical protein [Aeromicrobium sp. Leaf350]|uniref:hypothetical protein n=1 Tax=Aeromicrobium sp. Leaf350 TaxID=2876565 RepID=UPI001E2DE105|nr:hypothetical protein [Aeromicrobium sp. Leaf350]